MGDGNAAAPPPHEVTRHELDVRPILRDGGEPFSVIMGAVEQLAPGVVLRLVTTFDPVPLHTVMGRQGFAHHTRRVADDHFVTEYWEAAASADTAPSPSAAATGHVRTIDVRGLAPPEPIERPLVALDALPAGWRLRQVNVRVPAFLLPLLDERGFRYTVDDRGDHVVTEIWRAS